MSLALLFAGQGAQKVGMGKSLCEHSPAARALYDEANSILGWDLKKISTEGPEAELTRTRVCQPALYVHGLAVLAALREVRGSAVQPAIAFGLSLGELTACAAAGVFDFATGLRLVAERGRLMQLACEHAAGAMAAIVGEDPEKVKALCQEFDIEEANFNGPGQIIVSGEKTKIAQAVSHAKDRGIKKIIPLNVAGAYHSRLMEPARAGFATALSSAHLSPPRLILFTNTALPNLPGRAVSEPEEIRAALASQIISAVHWESCMRHAAAAGATEFWELGPGGVLAGLARRIDKSWSVKSFSEWSDISA